jgi:glycosyltransferase involved in cell wall biosynthesis
VNTFLVIPSFNEDKRLTETVRKAMQYIPPQKIIIIDDGSKVPEYLPKNTGVWLLRHKLNLGKGAAMRTGAEFAFGQGADAVIFMDADCQHDPKEIPIFHKFLNEGYQLVFGSRRPGINVPLTRFLGTKFTSVYINLIFGVYISDILSGFRALTKKAYDLVKWESDRYAVETEMVARMSHHKKELSWIEFPVETIYMDKYKGMTPIDAIRLLLSSIKWKLG